MAGSKHVSAAVVSIGVLVVMVMVAESSAAGGCNPKFQRTVPVAGRHPGSTSRQCYNVLKGVDKTCMCNQLNSASFPAQMVTNGLRLPKKCGPQGPARLPVRT